MISKSKPQKIVRSLWLLALLFLLQHSLLANPSVVLVSSNSHFSMVHRIEAALFSQPTHRPNIKHKLVDQLDSEPNFDTNGELKLIVTIGAEALESVLKTKTQKPILSVLIRKNTFENLLTIYHRKQNDTQKPISVIYLDQPLQRQVNLIKQIMPSIVESEASVGVLFGPASISAQDQLLQIAAKEKIKLNTIYVNNFENPVAVMDAFLSEVKLLLAIPDTRIYNPRTARGILLAAFHKHVPLIGYSQSYVKNGALVSVFSNTKQIAQQAAQTILTTLNQGKLPPPQYPDEFSVEINYQVAKSLKINMKSESRLRLSLIAMEEQKGMNLTAQYAVNY